MTQRRANTGTKPGRPPQREQNFHRVSVHHSQRRQLHLQHVWNKPAGLRRIAVFGSSVGIIAFPFGTDCNASIGLLTPPPPPPPPPPYLFGAFEKRCWTPPTWHFLPRSCLENQRSVYRCRVKSASRHRRAALRLSKETFFSGQLRIKKKKIRGRSQIKGRTDQSELGVRPLFYLTASGRHREHELNRGAPQWPILGALKIPPHQLFRLRWRGGGSG